MDDLLVGAQIEWIFIKRGLLLPANEIKHESDGRKKRSFPGTIFANEDIYRTNWYFNCLVKAPKILHRKKT
jgi:hypothetical protein